jgi:alkylation response protein AidB-like acyl-CoA dehydrogenase
MAGAPVQQPDGGFAIRMHVVPMSACRLHGNWQVAGLEATCSQDLTVEDVFVPQRRIFDVNVASNSFASQYAGGASSKDDAGGQPVGMSIQESTVLGLTGVAGWALGVARRALDELEAMAPNAKRLLSPGRVAEDFHVQIGLSHAEGRLRASRAHLFALLTEMQAAASSGGVSESLRVALFEASLEATASARAAVLFAYDSAPTSVVYRHSPIQRCVRDMMVGLKHAAVSTTMQAKVGMARMGLPDHGL